MSIEGQPRLQESEVDKKEMPHADFSTREPIQTPDKKRILQKIVLVPKEGEKIQEKAKSQDDIPTGSFNYEHASSPYFNIHQYNKAAEILDKQAGLRDERLRRQTLPEEQPEDMEELEIQAATPDQMTSIPKPPYIPAPPPPPGQFESIQQVPTEKILEQIKVTPTGEPLITQTGVQRVISTKEPPTNPISRLFNKVLRKKETEPLKQKEPVVA